MNGWLQRFYPRNLCLMPQRIDQGTARSAATPAKFDSTATVAPSMAMLALLQGGRLPTQRWPT